MADNATLPAIGRRVATDEVTHSGDTADVQLVRVEYRCIYVRNNSGADVMTDLRVFIAAKPHKEHAPCQ